MNTQLRNGPAWTPSLENSMNAPEEDAHSHPVHLLTCQLDQAMGAPRRLARHYFQGVCEGVFCMRSTSGSVD